MERIVEILKKYNQHNMLEIYNSLTDKEKLELADDIKKVNFEEMNNLFKMTKENNMPNTSKITPIENVCIKDNLEAQVLKEWEELGEKIIKDGRYAVVTMAGGQGTRLGHDKPKGTYMLDICGTKISIFELLINKLKKSKEKYGVTIPWYIMTSEENNKDTVDFFESNDFFGYDKSSVVFFKQGQLPMQDINGDLVLETQTKIKFAANGNGGVFKAICDNVLQDIKKRNIEYLYISGVDNILVNFVDTAFLGGMIKNGYICASKSVLKLYPEEKVGLICKKDDRPAVVEYSELPCDMRTFRKDNGELMYSESYIVSNIFNVDLISKAGDLPYHVANKKCKVLKANGTISEENIYKYETFIFDIYNKVSDMFVFRVKREEEFAPIKNKEGEDSPKTAVELYTNFIINRDK